MAEKMKRTSKELEVVDKAVLDGRKPIKIN